MSTKELSVRKKLSPFGVELKRDLREPLNDGERSRLRQLFNKHHLLIFRNQALSLAQQEDLCSSFGPILTDELDRMDFISNDPTIGILGGDRIVFHSDLAFTPQPFPMICLHAVDVSENSAATSFASGPLAYKKLPQEMKDGLLGLQGLNCLTAKLDVRTYEMDVPANFPRALHPVVIDHPATGEPMLYVNYMQTSRIVGMTEEASEILLNDLFAELYAPENIYHHHWQKGDLVIWDNIALQHARLEPAVERRTLQRVTGGEVGMRTLFPHTRKLFGDTSASNVMQAPSKKLA